jgi:hypothetical protein
MEWTWQIVYNPAAPIDSVTAAALEVDEISYDLVDAQGAVVWSAPTGSVRNVTRGDAVTPPTTQNAPGS